MKSIAIQNIHNFHNKNVVMKWFTSPKQLVKDMAAEIIKSDEYSDADVSVLKTMVQYVPDTFAVVNKAINDRVNEFESYVLSDGLVSQNEYNSIVQWTKNLKVNIFEGWDSLVSNLQEGLNRHNQLEAMVPLSGCSIRLVRNEIAYRECHSDMLETRKHVTSVSYAAPRITIPIGKYVKVPIGNIRTHAHSTTQWTTINTGSLVLTNRRLVLVGSDANAAVKLSDIVRVIPYMDGFAVHRNSGKVRVYKTNEPLTGHMLSKLLSDS